ncbi:MAG TPA: TrkA family potassium uptake protein [Solirubrobacteraceae bacterium]|jgi:voltage-gated potassium channel|nr:TrkA family potassium uptake protein [Solirubrobacteraceae bacterium]
MPAPAEDANRSRPSRSGGSLGSSRLPGLRADRPSTRGDLAVFVRRMAQLGGAIAALLALGTAGFVVAEGVSVWFAFQWALDTVATVGSIPPPPDTAGQVVKVALIVLGVGTLFYALVTVTEFFVAGHLAEIRAERRMLKMIASLTDHYIICGFGRVGRQVARDLRVAQAKYVVVDANTENRDPAQGIGVRFLEGDAADDEVLRQAGIERARAIIACADSDAENIFITLTAREMRADIAIVARASVEDSEKKLKRAGADRVISPYKSSGTEMARLALHPQITGVVDVDAEYRMEEIAVTAGCIGVNQTIGDIRGGSMIVALRRSDGTFQPQPPAEAVLEAGDILMAMGTPRTLDRLEALFMPASQRSASSSPAAADKR